MGFEVQGLPGLARSGFEGFGVIGGQGSFGRTSTSSISVVLRGMSAPPWGVLLALLVVILWPTFLPVLLFWGFEIRMGPKTLF